MMIRKMILHLLANRRKKQFFKADNKNTFGLTPKEIKRAHQLGFLLDEYAINDLAHNDAREYISEYERMQFREQIRDYRIVFDNKILFYSIIRNFAPTNTIYAYKVQGQFVQLEAGISELHLTDLLERESKLVMKLNTAGGGVGFELLRCSDGKYFVNQQEYSRDNLSKHFQEMDNYLIEKFCEQSEFENQIFPYSVNTIRLLTATTKEQTVEILGAVHRFGANQEIGADNACLGGLFALIDTETGRLHQAYSKGKDTLFDENRQRRVYKSHPLTNAPIEGIVIPNWQSLCDNMTALHQKLSFIGAKFIAWDIALTNHGFCIIEGNASCSFDLVQGESGVRNQRIGQFFKSYNYIQ